MIKILAQNNLYVQTLESALGPFLKTLEEGKDVSLLLSIIERDTSSSEQKNMVDRAKKTASFLILEEDANFPEENKQYFDMVFNMPVRLGLICKHIQSFHQKKLTLAAEKPIEFSHVTFKPKECLLSFEDKDVYLTEKENHILYYLYMNQGMTVSRSDMLNEIWGYNSQVETHTLETHIYRLRQKLEITPADPAVLTTVENGYLLKF